MTDSNPIAWQDLRSEFGFTPEDFTPEEEAEMTAGRERLLSPGPPGRDTGWRGPTYGGDPGPRLRDRVFTPRGVPGREQETRSNRSGPTMSGGAGG